MALSDRKIVMSGASGGIGRHLVALLTHQGATVATISRAEEKGARHLQADLARESGIALAAEFVAHEKPDILINLAGVQYFGPLEAQPQRDIRESYNVNLIAPVTLCRAALPVMRDRGAGQIVNIGSIFGSISFAHFVSYSSAKAGLRSFSEALRRELVDSGIDVTYIAPRAVRTAAITPIIDRYAALTGMAIDQPAPIAARIARAIVRRRKDVYFGFPESAFARVNAVFPRVVDRALAGKDRKARRLFAS